MSDEESHKRDEEDTGRRRSSRKTVSSKKVQRQSALEELKNSRLSGKIYRRNTDNLVKDVYELVTEEEYAKIQRQRATGNFVENDDGTGYFDDGTVDDFEEDGDFDEDEGLDDKPTTSKSSRKSHGDKKIKGSMYDFLNINHATNSKESDNTPCNIHEDPDVLDLLNQLDQSHSEPSAREKPLFRFGSNNFVEPVKNVGSNKFVESIKNVVEAPAESFNTGTTLSWPSELPFDEPFNEPVIESKVESVVKPKVEPKTEIMSLLPEKMDSKPVKRPATAYVSDVSAPKAMKFDVDMERKEDNEQEVDASTLRMYWIETFEDVYKKPGSVYLFGKVDGKSCCVIVKHIEHKVYFLPRETDGDMKKILSDMHAEVQEKFANNKFFHVSDAKDRVIQAKPKNIKWIPTDDKIPRELPALVILYKGHLPKIALGTSGETFSRVLNTTSTSMERLLLETKLRGPCWIDITNAVVSKRKLSHCDLEYVVDMKSANDYNIKPAEIKKPDPFVNLLALNIVGAPSSNGKETQIIMISCLYRKKGLLERANDPSQNAYEPFCLMTHPKNGVMPLTVDAELKRLGISEESVRKIQNERAMLNLFFANFKQYDPDVIIAHDVSAQISFLMARAEKYSIKTWSFIGRLSKDQAPSRFCKTKAGQWELMAGRSVLCSKTAAEELYPTRSYELGDLIALLMPNENRVQLTSTQIIEPFLSSKANMSVGQLIQWSWLESYYALQIVLQLNALPLFVQITKIVGGVLSRTLLGGRSERNEYLLLHAFHDSGYISPDKPQFGGGKKKGNASKNNTQADDDETKTGASRKAQYTGGLVLEPRKGFYDSYIVLLDFNSLYPSIIQEFNICFTTIDRCYEEPDEKGLPELPKDSMPEGILSIEIGSLVRNRREVKAQMQKTKPGTDEYMQLDVRQKGLKLTANSMYGCLGFGMSRFCAKTLAAMITFKGRELLSRTKEIVEKRGYTVVYGDTDSIMINTNTAIYNDACRLAYDLRKIVNGGFRYIEMDVDGLFKRLLLLKKKKYAALTVSLKSEANAKKEMKGLDIVRRDWSKLAKDVGERVVDLILDSKEREDLVNDVVGTLNELAGKLKSNEVPLEDFEILKQLTRAPNEYVDAKNQPHVLVSTRLNASKNFHLRQGDVVKYVICQDGTSNSAVQRAYHLTELASNENLKIDTHYYLSQQVHPVVMRLCEPFSELDSGRIAESLGLNPSSYHSKHASSQSVDYSPLELPPDAFAEFEHCESFSFKCPNPKCDEKIDIRNAFLGQGLNVYLSLKDCPKCHETFERHYDYLRSTLLIQLNTFIRKHSSAKYVCEDQTCGYQEVDTSELVWTSSHGPVCPQCNSTFMHKEYSLRDLFYQQKFFKRIFDYKSHIDKYFTADQKNLLNTTKGINQTVGMYGDFEKLTLEHMKNNRYNKVDLGRILSGFKRLF